MKKMIGFFAGALFSAALIVTCGGGGFELANDAGSGQGAGEIRMLADIGVGEAHAQSQPATTVGWEYAVVTPAYIPTANPIGIGMPNGIARPNLAACSEKSDAELYACFLNILGTDKWELAGIDTNSVPMYVFKRAK